MFLFKKKCAFHSGLDISQEGFTLVSLSFENGKYVLQNYYTENFNEKVFHNGIIIKPDVFSEKLKKIIQKNNFDIKSVNINVASNYVFIKTVTLPDLPDDELKIIAPQEAAKHSPQTIKEINVDYQKLEDTKNGNKIDVILCSLLKNTAKNFIDTFSLAEIEVEAIDVSSFAMIRTLSNAQKINNPINVIKNGMPIFSHNILTGKQQILEAIMKGFEIQEEEANKRLHEFMIILPGMDFASNSDINKASNILRNIFSGLASEIQKTIEFYSSQSGETIEPARIIIGGSGVCVQNIHKYISNKLKIPAEICNPLENITHNLEISENNLAPINIPALSTSIGLALKSFESQ
jgi:type IV pilus assembly protein PilM